MTRRRPRQEVAGPAWPDQEGSGRIVFLVDVASRIERRLVDRWIQATRPTEGACDAYEVLPIPPTRRRRRRQPVDPRLQATLALAHPGTKGRAGTNGSIEAKAWAGQEARSDDALMAPLRVIWRARLRDGHRRASFWGLLTAGDPRDPGWLRQIWILRTDPDRCVIVAGEPAPASDLRRRWIEACGADSAETEGFAEFVAQKATLALERAERAVRGARYKVPRLVREEILGRPAFRGGLARLAEAGPDAKGRRPTPAKIESEATRNLKEIAATHSPLVIDLLTSLIHWLYRRGYDETLAYDPAAMKGIAALEERHPVVFLPSHKSNLDHLVLQYALHENGLPPNHTAGGINMNFFPVGPIVRRSGVFFIRRSFRDAPVYRHVLGSYIDYLIEKRFPLEWYIEGGRSRSGKLLPPRFGLLANVVDAYRRGKSDDLYLVPVSIAYDQIQDLGSYVAEQRGGAKQTESFSWFLRVIRQMKRRYGRIHIAFGEPLSLRQQLGAPGEAHPTDDQRSLDLQKLAFEVSVRINRVTPITPTSLLTLALLGATGEALTIPETRRSLANLIAAVRARGLPTTADFHHLESDEGIRLTLDALVDNGVVTRFDDGIETVYGIGEGQQLSAAYYRNTVVHFFVGSAIAELGLLHAHDAPREKALESFWDEVMRLRDLLKFEFFFSDKESFREEIRAELEIGTRDWEKKIAGFELDPDDLVRRSRPFCAHRVLRPFLESYRVVADQLSTLDPASPVDEKRLLSDCLRLGRQYERQKRIHAADSVSKVLFQTALRLADNRGLLEAGSEELASARRAFAEELRDAVRRVDIIVALAAGRRAGFRS
ncbi:MAG: glycerol-3-phosphate 1-O-acyltransferase [bacterium]